MDYRYKKENHDFWVERLKTNSPETVCTNDVGLDRLESEQILSRLADNSTVLEVGCGNGLLYEIIRRSFDLHAYVGTDFVEDLIDVCAKRVLDPRDKFEQLDMTAVNEETFTQKFDFIVSKRAIQNVIDTELQLRAIDNLGYHLKGDGQMVLVESSADSLKNINVERSKYGLNEIEPPFHNLFFDDARILKHNFKNVTLKKIVPFASDFYFVTRIVYARLAKEFLNERPHYEHPLEKIGLSMKGDPCTTSFSQIQCYVFSRK